LKIRLKFKPDTKDLITGIKDLINRHKFKPTKEQSKMINSVFIVNSYLVKYWLIDFHNFIGTSLTTSNPRLPVASASVQTS
jgi:hypothetical protein